VIDLGYTVYSFVALFLIVYLITNVPVPHSLEMYSARDRIRMIRRYVIITAGGGSASCDAATLAAADISGDGCVTSSGALIILQAATDAIELWPRRFAILRRYAVFECGAPAGHRRSYQPFSKKR